ncbi:hypothetical protein [Streptomyces sp. NPDC056227]|uniref:hypothetical protein n=1 Tax=Streptomyces sp. NPDC056227 TaxID=3345753 RepID=UPI0035DC11EB
MPEPPAPAVVRGTSIMVTLQVRTMQEVLVTAVRLTVTSRTAAPAKETMVGFEQCGGGVEERYVDRDLSRPAAAWKACPEEHA